jgi:hypothetical protein
MSVAAAPGVVAVAAIGGLSLSVRKAEFCDAGRSKFPGAAPSTSFRKIGVWSMSTQGERIKIWIGL